MLDEFTFTAGFETTVIDVVSPLIQPFASIPTTVYCVVEDGFPVTVAPVVELSPVPGIQL
jgi:hypothetical protein